MERVVVIGAGMAGLAAARGLHRAGTPVVVVEARDRIGGRTHTVDVAGVPVDLGAAWVHDGTGSPLLAPLRRLGVRLLDAAVTDLLGDAVVVDPRTRRADPRLRAEVLAAFDAVVERGGDHAAHVGDDVSVDQALRDLLPGASDTVRGTLGAALGVFDGADPDDLGFRGLVDFLGDRGLVDRDVFPAGGYRTLIEALADGLDVRTGTPVEAVTDTGSGVVVHTSAGEVTGSHAVVTLPVGVLKAGAVDFRPGLPAAKRAALDALDVALYEKAVLAYDAPRWRRGNAGVALLATDGTRPQWQSVLDLGRWHSGAPVLVTLAMGRMARLVAGMTPSERADSAERAARLVAADLGRPLDVVTTDWACDPWSLGAYTRRARGVTAEESMAAVAALAAPHGRLLFAGEATSEEAPSLVDGAWLSGLREAARLARGPVPDVL